MVTATMRTETSERIRNGGLPSGGFPRARPRRSRLRLSESLGGKMVTATAVGASHWSLCDKEIVTRYLPGDESTAADTSHPLCCTVERPGAARMGTDHAYSHGHGPCTAKHGSLNFLQVGQGAGTATLITTRRSVRMMEKDTSPSIKSHHRRRTPREALY